MQSIRDAMTAVVLCANDPVSAWGGARILRDQFGIEPAVVTGPATDNAVGVDQIVERMSLPAINALSTVSRWAISWRNSEAEGGRMSDAIQAVVLGATGYVGGELLRLIAAHPDLRLAAAVSESCSGQPVVETFPHLTGAITAPTFSSHDGWLADIAAGSELALFSAAPHGASAALIATALCRTRQTESMQVHVVDSSADFRYSNQADYETGLRRTNTARPNYSISFSSSVPEHVSEVAAAHIGHPGCFATAILLASVPLISSGFTAAEVFVAATTGSTGSGRSPQAGTHHPERHSNTYAYKPLSHRHAPEIASIVRSGQRPRHAA